MPQVRKFDPLEPVTHLHPVVSGVSMHGPEIQIHPHPAAPHAVASTDGSRIFLNLPHHRLSAAQWLQVIGHELAHILQQRLGRVRPTATICGILCCDDPALEQEADLLAPVFARLMTAGFCPYFPPQNSDPILQNLIGIRGRPIQSPAQLLPQAQSLMQLIPGGSAWLASIAGASTQYNFANDFELLAGIQAGVHGEPVMMLRKLQIAVHPEALSGFARDEMDSLVAVERGTGDNSVTRMRVRRLFATQQLLTESELLVGDEFPDQIGLNAEPLFRSRSLPDRIALFNLVNDGVTEQALDTRLQSEAAQFAVGRALNIPEFVDFYRFYLALLPTGPIDSQLADKRSRLAEAAADALSDVSFDLLWAPTLDSAPQPSALPGIVSQWSDRGLRLGFPRLSAALAHLAVNVPINGATGLAARQIIEGSMNRLQQLWIGNVPGSVRVAQSGVNRLYAYELPSATAQLSLASDGTLTVANYRPRTPEQAKP